MGKIIEFPDDKKLRKKLEKLRKSLEDLLLERDNLYFVVKAFDIYENEIIVK